MSSNHVARPLSARQLMLVRSAAVLLLLAACLLSGPTRPPIAALLLGLPVGRRMQLGAIGPTKRPIAPSLSALLTKQLDGLASVCLRWPPLNRLRLSCFPNHELGWPRTAIWSDRGSARRKLAPICAHLAPNWRPLLAAQALQGRRASAGWRRGRGRAARGQAGAAPVIDFAWRPINAAEPWPAAAAAPLRLASSTGSGEI